MARVHLAKLVFDEAHLISNGKSNRSTAAQILSTEADQVIAATGTPLWNKPAGLHSILTCINPGAWGKRYDYCVRYANGHPGAYGFVADGVSNVDEFKARLSEIMLRRVWTDVVKDLPPIERTVEVVDLDEEQCYELEKSAEEIRDATALRTPIGELARYRRLVAALKIDAAIEAAQRVLDGGESVVLWTWHKDVAQKLYKKLEKKYAAYVVTGEETDQDKREAALDQWRAKDPSALVINIGVGQAGIDLSHARHAIFCEIDWVPATVAQAEMRTFSPLRPMTSTYIVVDHRVDRALVEALTTKCELGDQLGVPAAESAIGSLGTALGIGQDSGDMNRLMSAVLDGIEA
jgi:SWI/SNF-related matrix-associated actin-dependent regulator of chromatin subfamily A-like protein 1